MITMECMRCGYCCMNTHDTLWLRSSLTAEQALLLKIERERYPIREDIKYCKALIFEYKRAVCLVQKLFGYDKKPEICKNFEACNCDEKFPEKNLD